VYLCDADHYLVPPSAAYQREKDPSAFRVREWPAVFTLNCPDVTPLVRGGKPPGMDRGLLIAHKVIRTAVFETVLKYCSRPSLPPPPSLRRLLLLIAGLTSRTVAVLDSRLRLSIYHFLRRKRGTSSSGNAKPT